MQVSPGHPGTNLESRRTLGQHRRSIVVPDLQVSGREDRITEDFCLETYGHVESVAPGSEKLYVRQFPLSTCKCL